MINKQTIDKRIPDAAIVGTGPTVVYDDDPDLYLYDLSKIVIKKRNSTSVANYISSPPISSGGILAQFANPSTKEKGYTAVIKKYQEKLYWHMERLNLKIQ